MSDLTYRQHGYARYTDSDYVAMVELLTANGWSWDWDTMNPRGGFSGWWVNPAHETKCRRTGDAKDFYTAALDTVRLYTDISPDEVFDHPRSIGQDEQTRQYRRLAFSMA